MGVMMKMDVNEGVEVGERKVVDPEVQQA